MKKLLANLFKPANTYKVKVPKDPIALSAFTEVQKCLFDIPKIDSYGICHSICERISEVYGVEAEVHLSHTFLSEKYGKYSGRPSFPVPSGTCFPPSAKFLSTKDFLKGRYGKNRMSLLRILRKYYPRILFTAEGICVIWCTDKEYKKIKSMDGEGIRSYLRKSNL